jgi:hypothetical protein
MKDNKHSMASGMAFINTPLQRSGAVRIGAGNRFSGFSFCSISHETVETAEAVEIDPGRSDTPLKRGVNESEERGCRELPGRLSK